MYGRKRRNVSGNHYKVFLVINPTKPTKFLIILVYSADVHYARHYFLSQHYLANLNCLTAIKQFCNGSQMLCLRLWWNLFSVISCIQTHLGTYRPVSLGYNTSIYGWIEHLPVLLLLLIPIKNIINASPTKNILLLPQPTAHSTKVHSTEGSTKLSEALIWSDSPMCCTTFWTPLPEQ